jgi:hypothetical protein
VLYEEHMPRSCGWGEPDTLKLYMAGVQCMDRIHVFLAEQCHWVVLSKAVGGVGSHETGVRSKRTL